MGSLNLSCPRIVFFFFFCLDIPNNRFIQILNLVDRDYHC